MNCPACGYPLGFLAWDDDSPSHEMCPGCGIQFGYDDAAGGNLERRRAIYEQWRQEWVRNGMRWFSKGTPVPIGWDPAKQLSRLTQSASDARDRD